MNYWLSWLIALNVLILPLLSTQPEQKNTDSSNIFTTFDKQYINDRIMTIDYGSHRARLDQHIYQVREGSIGGYDAVGGSCGCN